VFIPFYNYNSDPCRTALSAKVLKHYARLRATLAPRAKLTFTVLGSEGRASKQLVLEHLRPDEYAEYAQDSKLEMWDMLSRKMKHGIWLATAKAPDVVLIAGSNDFVSANFFDQLLDFFDPDVPQVYGVDNYYDGCRNVILFGEYDHATNGLYNTRLWDGVSHFAGREDLRYTGGIIGFNRALYASNQKFVDDIGHDEGQTERAALAAGARKLTTRRVVFINPKTPSGKDLNTMQHIDAAELIRLDLTKDYDEAEVRFFREQLGEYLLL
jgi:hypothetical protein